MNDKIFTEYTAILAEFDGNCYGLKEYFSLINKTEILKDSYKYHSSWDWLLPVYKKLSDAIYLNENKFEKFEWNRLQAARYMIEHDLLNFEIEKVFIGVAELIKLFKLLLEIKK